MLDSIQPRDPRRQKFVQRSHEQYQRPRPKKRFRLRLALIMLALLTIGIFVGSRVVTLAQKIFDNTSSSSLFGQLFIANDTKLIGEAEGEVRFLLMGIGGAGHDGGTLTDTIILGTMKFPENEGGQTQVGLVSIPRDLTVFIPGYDYRKINSAHAFGEIGDRGEGPKLAVEAVERVIDQNIPYYAVIDFEGFETIIDELGGVQIDVKTGFTDSRFPDNNNGFLDPITFEEGRQKMNGERALQYVRSRHGNNEQGSDFARAKRQQQVLQTVADEVSNIRILTNFSLISRILNAVADNFRTNLEPHEVKRLYDIGRKIKSDQISTISIDGESGLVCDEIVEENGAYVLVPCEGLARYDQIRNYINSQFTSTFSTTENPTVEIQNATTIPGLSGQTKTYLSLQNAEITTANYRGAAQFIETVIYDNTGGEKNQTLEFLQQKLEATVAASAFPFPTTSENPDFVIVITGDIQGRLP